MDEFSLMIESLLLNEPLLRFGVFVSVFVIMAGWEILAPRRTQMVSRWLRWPNNLGLVVLNTVLLRFFVPTAAVGFALIAEEHSWGLFNNIELHYWMTVTAAVILLDLAIYLQHILFHIVPLLWRLHRMHHADLDFDVTTGTRFHPLEIILSMFIKLAVVVVLGPPAIAVLLFEVLLNATAIFNHANVKIPTITEHYLRFLVVTPDMHRVHHSIRQPETNSNFGFNLPWWDHLFGTYRAQPADGHEHMTIGLKQFRNPQDLRLDRLLIQPFLNSSDTDTGSGNNY